MKPFNLERALAGDPIITRDGKPARIICIDKKGSQPIVALIFDENDGDIEGFATYDNKGNFLLYDGKSNNDLFMVSKKTTYWVNIYKNINECTGYYTGQDLFSCLESAKKFQRRNCIGAFEIEIEE